MSDNDPQSPGGMGDAGQIVPESERRHIRADLRMMARAIKRRWIIPKDADEVLPNEMYQIATTREIKMMVGEGETAKEVTVSNSRAQVAATKILLEMEAQNQADEVAEAEAQRGPSGNVTVIVERTARKPLNADQGNSPALPPGAVADDRQRATIQRGDVRPAIGQDNDGGVSGG